MLRSRENGWLTGKAIYRCTSLILGDATPKHFYIGLIQPATLAILDSEAQQGWFLAEPSHWLVDIFTRVVGIDPVEKCPRLSLAVVRELWWRTNHISSMGSEGRMVAIDSPRLGISAVEGTTCSQLTEEHLVTSWESTRLRIDSIKHWPRCHVGCRCYLPKSMIASFRLEMRGWLHNAMTGKFGSVGFLRSLASQSRAPIESINELRNLWPKIHQAQINLTLDRAWPIWQFPRFVERSLYDWQRVGVELNRLNADASQAFIAEVMKEVERLCHSIGEELDMLAEAEEAEQKIALCGCDSP